MNLFQEEKSDSIVLATFLQKHLKLLILTGLISGLAAFGVTMLIPHKYASSAKFFPPDYRDSITILQNSRLGIELHTDRLIELLRSDQVKARLVKELDLFTYYQLDSKEKETSEILYQKIANDLIIERTPMLSVIVTATTREPELSAKFANAVVDMTDELWADVYREKGPVDSIYVVERAQISYQAVSPSYWKNVGVAIVGVVMFLVVVLGFYEATTHQLANP